MPIDEQLCTALRGMALTDALSSEENSCNDQRVRYDELQEQGFAMALT